VEAVKFDPFALDDEEMDELFAQFVEGEEKSTGFYPMQVHDVQDELEAERHLTSMQRLELEDAKLQAHRDAMIERANDWYDKQSKPLAKRSMWHSDALKAYLSIVGKKTLKLVNGVIKSRAGGEKTVVDDSQFLPWAEENYPTLINETTTYTPIKKDIKKLHKEKGILPPGVEFVVSEDSFKVELGQ